MNRLHIVLSVVVFVLFCLFLPAQAKDIADPPSRAKDQSLDDVVVKVGYVEFLGLTHTDPDGKPAGLVNEITMKTLEHAGIRYTIASYPAVRLFDDLARGKIDLFNGLSTIPAFKNATISRPLNLFPLEMRIYFIGDKKLINFREDLAGSRVGMTRGYSYDAWGDWIRNRANGVKYDETDTHDASFNMLQKGRVDYLLTYKYIDDICLKNLSIPDLRFHVPSSARGWHCTFNLYKHKPKADLILQKMEESYWQLIKSGQLKRYQ